MGADRALSEDVDLFVHPNRFTPPLQAARAVNRELKSLRDRVAAHPGLRLIESGSNTIGGKSRSDTFGYASVFDELAGIRPEILLEPGIQSGDYPTEEREITSHVADFLNDRGQGGIADDTIECAMTLLHFRRTFVEKLFTVHSKVERIRSDGGSLGRDARHYADLHVLADRQEVLDMIGSEEYAQIKEDYDRTSRAFYGDRYRPPDGLVFIASAALDPPAGLKEELERSYVEDCAFLFPSSSPAP